MTHIDHTATGTPFPATRSLWSWMTGAGLTSFVRGLFASSGPQVDGLKTIYDLDDRTLVDIGFDSHQIRAARARKAPFGRSEFARRWPLWPGR